MICYTTSTTEKDLLSILSLQKINLANTLTKQEIETEGFVTVSHNINALTKLNNIENHIIAKDDDTVIDYLLAMTYQSKFEVPILTPMFNVFDKVLFANKPISTYNYIVVGQACISKAYRGQGVLDKCYATYKEHFMLKYDFAITEIASTNLRSMKAHKRIGFEEISSYTSPDGTDWRVVLWNWKNIAKAVI